MEQIIKTCFDYLDSDYLKDQFRWQTGMKKELERLRENHPKIQAVLDFAANQAQINDKNRALNKWIWQLRDAIDEANDVLDELEYMKHKEQLPKNTEETKKRKLMSFLFESACKILKIGERGLKIDPNLKRLEEAVQKLDELSADGTFLHLLDSAKQEQKEQEVDFYKTRETGYLPKNDLIGRRKDKEIVMNWLRNPSNEYQTTVHGKISLLCIVGHGGLGKTTLLQHVYKDEEITKEFDLKMWVCVSNNFDVKKVIADMLECLKEERPRLETLVALQSRLEGELMFKKFLLVLDDIWEEEEERDQSKWENVLAPLASGSFGSKILVTTRMDSIALTFAKVIQKKTKIVRLECLEEDECLQLLNYHAFAGVENPSDDYKKLRDIAGEIVKKLLGSPLAAKVIGGVLKDNLDEIHWRKVLESNLLGQNSVDSILRLSYIVLSNPLKSCFAICCMFPQDHKYHKDVLIQMWIALDFIQPSQEMTMEDIRERYFDVLVKKTLLEKVGDDYKMHDLIHESASKFFAQECGKLVDDAESSLKISQTIRHLSVQTINSNIIEEIEKFKHLHSLFLFNKGSNEQDLCNVLIKIFKASTSLRLLYIGASPCLKMIPEEIGNLIHLRYLKIDGYNLTMLPRSLSNLYHMQYIIIDLPWWQIHKPKGDDFLPSDINNLSNLRYVELPCDTISSICGIGKLKFLQELNTFSPRDVSGYRIGELENMNDLCKLEINCLENVKDGEEARSAKLFAKRRLTHLTLCWSNTDLRNIDLDENVLDNLQPPKCLRNLSIKRYMSARSAIWMNNVNLISNLEKIELENCREWETLPPFGQLPNLKSLTLSEMPKVKCFKSNFNGNDKCHAFPLLEELYISELEALEDWFEEGVATEDGCLFPCLIDLVLADCPKLKELPSLPSKLKSLELRNMPKVKCFKSNFNGNDKCHAFPLLEVLRICDLESLEDWFETGVAAEDGCLFPCLINLSLIHCPKLKELPSLPSKLKRLEIYSIGLKTLNFCSNSNPLPLETLVVMDCPSITSLNLADEIARLAALRDLRIKKCPNLISLGRYREVETTNNCHLMLNDLNISDPSVLLMEPLRSIASLKRLTISSIDEVVSFSNEAEQWFLKVRSSLSELVFSYLKSLESLPSSLESLSSLQHLCIYDVPMLRELPNLPPSLECLSIGKCHPEFKERYREDGGTDWHKIAYIPRTNIKT